MRKTSSVLVVALLVLVFVAPATFAWDRGNPRESKKERMGAIPVPEGMMAVITPGGHDFVLLPGSPDDFAIAPDGTVLEALTERGQRILDAARNSFLAEKAAAEIFMGDVAGDGASVEVLGTRAPQLVECNGSYLCGGLQVSRTMPTIHLVCEPASGCNCQYWKEVCKVTIQ